MTQELATVQSYELIDRLASAVAKSNLYGIKTPEQAQVLMHLCRSKGLDPIQAVERYHIMNTGRPSMRADAMLAEFQARGGTVRWLERNATSVVAEFSHPQGGTIEVQWTIEMAQKAGITRNGTWQAYPRQMLTARVISEGVRTVLPGVVSGVYTPEEEGDIELSRAVPPPPPPPPAPTRVPRRAPAQAAPEPVAPATPSNVTEAEYTPVSQAAPEPAAPPETAAPPAAPAPAPASAPAPTAPTTTNPLQDWDPAERAAILADLPETADGMAFKAQSTLAKLLYKILPEDLAEATRAGLRGASSDAARIAILNQRLAEVRA